MKTFSVDVTSTSYAFEVDRQALADLFKREDYEFTKITLARRLEDLPGVFSVEYNGHLGPFIYLSIEAEFDTADRREEILEIIRNE